MTQEERILEFVRAIGVDIKSLKTTAKPISVEVNFGTIGNPIRNFTITDSVVTNNSIILVSPNPNAASGRIGNDWELDIATFTAIASTADSRRRDA